MHSAVADMKRDKGRYEPFLKGSQFFLYLVFVFLWFKDNFTSLKFPDVPYAAAAVPLLAVTLYRLYLRIQSRGLRVSLKPEKKTMVFLLILILVSLVRIPYLASHFGLMDGDEAVPALMGKHIAEGKRPPLFYYGAFFQGSLPSHLAAVLYKIFGYSNFLTKFSAHLFFILFLVCQYLFLKNIFSFDFACAVLLFYGLPFRHGLTAGFDVGSGYPLVLFFGTLILYLTYKICFLNREDLVPVLAFIMGLAFWTHQISAIFILTAAVFLIGHFRLKIKRYLEMFLAFCAGCFPVILNEFFEGFTLFRFLKGGEEGPMDFPERCRTATRFFLSLFSPERTPFQHVIPLLVFMGWVVLLVSLAWKRSRPRSMFAVFMLFFGIVYVFSDFSLMHVIRYHYILYAAVPVVLGALFLRFKPRIRFVSITVLFLSLFFLTGWKDGKAYLRSVKSFHKERKQTLQVLEETGKTAWMGEYWTSYLFNAVSREKITAASYSVERYYPYKLRYENSGETENWIFDMTGPDQVKKSSRLITLLDKTGTPYLKRRSGDYFLVYDIHGEVYPRTFQAPVPRYIPRISLTRAASSGRDIALHFTRESISAESFRLHINIEDFITRSVPLPGHGSFSVTVPIPRSLPFFVTFRLHYMGLPAEPVILEEASVFQEKPLERRRRVDYLTGFGPRRELGGKSLIVCAEKASFRLNNAVPPEAKILLHLHSPIRFDHPFWYGKYCQTVSVYVNDMKLKKFVLQDGKNILSIPCEHDRFRKEEAIITLRFKYVLVHSYRDLWKTAAFLEDISVITEAGE